MLHPPLAILFLRNPIGKPRMILFGQKECFLELSLVGDLFFYDSVFTKTLNGWINKHMIVIVHRYKQVFIIIFSAYNSLF